MLTDRHYCIKHRERVFGINVNLSFIHLYFIRLGLVNCRFDSYSKKLIYYAADTRRGVELRSLTGNLRIKV